MYVCEHVQSATGNWVEKAIFRVSWGDTKVYTQEEKKKNRIIFDRIFEPFHNRT